MATWEVETDLVVHCRVKVVVKAETREAAIDAAATQLPSNFDPASSRRWKAKVQLKPPKGVEIAVMRAYHFEQASGGDKARKVGP